MISRELNGIRKAFAIKISQNFVERNDGNMQEHRDTVALEKIVEFIFERTWTCETHPYLRVESVNFHNINTSHLIITGIFSRKSIQEIEDKIIELFYPEMGYKKVRKPQGPPGRYGD